MSTTDILHAYRHLLRASLRAVQFSLPARFVVVSQLRRAFRPVPGSAAPRKFDPEAVRRTVWFLKAAAAERGLEHRIVKNLVRVAHYRQTQERLALMWGTSVRLAQQERGEMKRKRKTDPIKATTYEHYEATIAMLNHSLGLCLPVR